MEFEGLGFREFSLGLRRLSVEALGFSVQGCDLWLTLRVQGPK